jgi:putative MATE family efflux protein
MSGSRLCMAFHLMNSTSRKAWSIAYPVIVGGFAQNIIHITDTAFLGRVGVVELGAAGLAGMWYFVFILFGMSLSAGLQVLVARRLGEENPKAVGQVMDQAIYISIVYSVLAFIFLQTVSPRLFGLFCDSAAVAEAGNTYIFWRSFDILFVVLTWVFRGFYNGVADNKIIIVSTIVLAGSNFVLNYLLIFGNWGFPALGVAGSAIASAIAETLGFLVMLVWLFRKRVMATYNLLRFHLPDKQQMTALLKLTAPMLLQHSIGMVAFLFLMVTIEKMGEDALAVSNLVKNVYIVFMIPTWGFGTAISTMVSFSVGQGKLFNVVPYIRRIVFLNFGAKLIITLPLVLAPHAVLSIFTNEPLIVERSLPVLYVIYAALLLYSISYIWFNALYGLGATRYTLMTEVICAALYLPYITIAAYVLTPSLPVLWGCEIVYMFMVGVFAYGYIRHKFSGKHSMIHQSTPQVAPVSH